MRGHRAIHALVGVALCAATVGIVASASAEESQHIRAVDVLQRTDLTCVAHWYRAARPPLSVLPLPVQTGVPVVDRELEDARTASPACPSAVSGDGIRATADAAADAASGAWTGSASAVTHDRTTAWAEAFATLHASFDVQASGDLFVQLTNIEGSTVGPCQACPSGRSAVIILIAVSSGAGDARAFCPFPSLDSASVRLPDDRCGLDEHRNPVTLAVAQGPVTVDVTVLSAAMAQGDDGIPLIDDPSASEFSARVTGLLDSFEIITAAGTPTDSTGAAAAGSTPTPDGSPSTASGTAAGDPMPVVQPFADGASVSRSDRSTTELIHPAVSASTSRPGAATRFDHTWSYVLAAAVALAGGTYVGVRRWVRRRPR